MDPPNSSSTTKNVFLGGAGARGMEIEGEFVKFTAIGVYLEDNVSPSLAPKWKGKTAHELTNSIHFFRDIITGPFEKVARVTMLVPLTGKEYSEKVTENCVKHWKEVGAYSDDEAKAIEKFLEVFKDEKFEPDASILFTISPTGSLRISFSKDSSEPEVENGLIENKRLSEAILESMIGEHGVSPEAKDSLGVRISDLLKQYEGNKAIGKDKLEAEKDAVESLHQIDGETVEVAEVEM